MQDNLRRGFSLIELLVVLLIFGILVSIAVPTLISTQPQRNLASASERFAGDINYCRAKAESTGNNIYLGFIYADDANQIDNGLDAAGALIDGSATANGAPGTRFDPPMNPGVSRVAKSYYIVEERPRNYDNGTPIDFKDDRPMTYLHYLIQYDLWDAGDKPNNNPPHPIEPRFPFDATKTLTLPEPERGGFNNLAAPLITYPMNMLAGNGTDYNARFVGEANIADWTVPLTQQYKTFCVADDLEIAGDGAGYPGYDVDGDRRFTPGVDNPRLKDLVYDYVLLKKVDLPEHVSFLNPWRSQWVVGNESGAQPYTMGTFQFLQYMVAFSPNGEVNLAQWGYDPVLFPPANSTYDANLVHGSVVLQSSVPEPKTIFMVVNETVYGGDGFAGDVREVRKSTQAECGRLILLWPLNGKYYVDDYAPKDHDRQLPSPNDPLLDLTQSNVTGNVRSSESDSTAATKAYAREYGYMQDFLDNPNLAPSAID